MNNYKVSSRYHCDVCDGERVLPADIVFGRAKTCTCGADPDGELGAMMLHDIDCDSVPCPFCQLLDESAHQEV